MNRRPYAEPTRLTAEWHSRIHHLFSWEGAVGRACLSANPEQAIRHNLKGLGYGY